MLTRIKQGTDRARSIFLGIRNNPLFALCFRCHVNMVERSSSPKVQALYELCTKTLTPSGIPPPTSVAVHKLCSLLDTISPSDVGLKEESPDDDRGHGFFGPNRLIRVARWAQPITYIDIYESDSFTMCIFCFPTSSVIPLHDHPGMTVFSKVLYGSLHVKAYDWVEPPHIHESNRSGYPSGHQSCTLKVGGIFTVSRQSPLVPCLTYSHLRIGKMLEGNVLTTVITLIPPSIFSGLLKSEPAVTGSEIVDEKEEEYAWLVETEAPDNLNMRPGLYTGPALNV